MKGAPHAQGAAACPNARSQRPIRRAMGYAAPGANEASHLVGQLCPERWLGELERLPRRVCRHPTVLRHQLRKALAHAQSVEARQQVVMEDVGRAVANVEKRAASKSVDAARDPNAKALAFAKSGKAITAAHNNNNNIY